MKYLTACMASLLAIGLAVSAGPAFAGGDGHHRKHARSHCHNCQKAKPKYDSTEVIKDTKDVDHSQVINTEKVVPSKRVVETNHLVVHENEVRNTGTVVHNHTVVEKELVITKRNVDHRYVNESVNLVQHKYNTKREHLIEEREVPGEVRRLRCNCGRGAALQVHGMNPRPIEAYRHSPRYVSSDY